MLKKFTYGIKYTDSKVAELVIYAESDKDAEQQLQQLLPAGRIYWLQAVEAMTGYAGGAEG